MASKDHIRGCENSFLPHISKKFKPDVVLCDSNSYIFVLGGRKKRKKGARAEAERHVEEQKQLNNTAIPQLKPMLYQSTTSSTQLIV